MDLINLVRQLRDSKSVAAFIASHSLDKQSEQIMVYASVQLTQNASLHFIPVESTDNKEELLLNDDRYRFVFTLDDLFEMVNGLAESGVKGNQAIAERIVQYWSNDA